MKRTTKALIAFIIFCYVAAFTVTALFALNGEPSFYGVSVAENDTNKTTRRLPGFSSVKFTQPDGLHYGSESGHGITFLFEESASLKSPEAIIPSAIDSYVKTSVSEGGVLNLALDFSSLADSTNDRSNFWVNLDVNVPVKICVPEGTLSTLDLAYVSHQIHFGVEDLDIKRFNYVGVKNLALTDCRIDSFLNTSGFKEKHANDNSYRRDNGEFNITMQKTVVKEMIVSRNPFGLTIRTDSLSSIGTLTRNFYGSDVANLTITDANIGILKWNPDSSECLNLRVSKPFVLDLSK